MLGPLDAVVWVEGEGLGWELVRMGLFELELKVLVGCETLAFQGEVLGSHWP